MSKVSIVVDVHCTECGGHVQRVERAAQGLLGNADCLIAGSSIKADQSERVKVGLCAAARTGEFVTPEETSEVPPQLDQGEARCHQHRIARHQLNSHFGIMLLHVPLYQRAGVDV